MIYRRTALAHASVYGVMALPKPFPSLFVQSLSSTPFNDSITEQVVGGADLMNDEFANDDSLTAPSTCEPVSIDVDIFPLESNVEGFDVGLPTRLDLTDACAISEEPILDDQHDVDNDSNSSSVVSLRIPSPIRQDQSHCFDKLVDMYDVDHTLQEILSEVSSVLDDSSDDDVVFRESLLLKLRAFASEARVSRQHMNTLLSILNDHGVSNFPNDYRTLLKECAFLDSSRSLADPFAQTSAAIQILVCGYCWLATFDDAAILNAVTCPHCEVATVRCPRPMCYTRCVLLASLGRRSMSSLTFCQNCERGSDSTIARRTFRFPLENYIRTAFSRPEFAHSLMAPFAGFCELRKTNVASG